MQWRSKVNALIVQPKGALCPGGDRTPQGSLVFHSDRGIQYCAQSFREALRERCPTVCQSMSRKGNCWDNAFTESFFKTLKAYYNRIRIHSVLDYVAPNVLNLVNAA
jgi:transposase InsO family protein